MVNFEDFVQDLPSVLETIYKECLGLDSVPPEVSTRHTPKDRNNYSVNRSLKELGVEEEALKKQLANYIQWMESTKKKKKKCR